MKSAWLARVKLLLSATARKTSNWRKLMDMFQLLYRSVPASLIGMGVLNRIGGNRGSTACGAANPGCGVPSGPLSAGACRLRRPAHGSKGPPKRRLRARLPAPRLMQNTTAGNVSDIGLPTCPTNAVKHPASWYIQKVIQSAVVPVAGLGTRLL